VLPGVVAGIGGYGNCLGLPTIGGEVAFDASYAGNPLVNALCVGVMRHEQLHLAKASGVGNVVILYGAKTGGDGIGGVSVLASETFGADGPAKRPSVQVGDPFMEKLLIECTLELFDAGLVAGIQDLGGAGLSCATAELASAGDGGMHVWLDRVPLRDSSLAPEEILMSESQERMMAVVEPADIEAFLAVCAKWDVDAAVIGEVTAVSARGAGARRPAHRRLARPAGGRRAAAHGGARGSGLRAALRPPGWPGRASQTRHVFAGAALDRRGAARDAAGAGRLAGPVRPLLGDRPVRPLRTRQHRARAAGGAPGVVRVDEESGLGVALATDCNARFVRLDPYAGAQLALAEAYRNVAVSGARPLAVTDCLNFGSPEDPGVMWQLAESVRGLADGCAALGVPVTGGNVSLYNQTGDTAILPTPVVGVLGVIDDVARRTPIGWPAPGLALYQLGETLDELDGSTWANVLHGHLGGIPPALDLEAERRLAEVLVEASRHGLAAAAHDLSDGGLAQALVESALRTGVGCRVELPGADPFASLFSESASRAVVAVNPDAERRFAELCAGIGVPAQRIGVTQGVGDDARLEVPGQFDVPLAELRAAWTATLPALFEP
jgi:phosphoribosylformylglycinamidine synthase